MSYRLRQMLAPGWIIIAGTVLVYAAFELLIQLQPPLHTGVAREFAAQQRVFLLIGCAAYGLYRGMALHPVWRSSYAQWLLSTPWNARFPLPLGPIHLVWQDALVLLVPVYLGQRGLLPSGGLPLVVFGCAYLAALGAGLLFTAETGIGWVCLYGLGLVLTAKSDAVRIAVCLACYGVAYVGLTRSLRRFPWTNEVARRIREKEKIGSSFDPGWPFNRLRPSFEQPPVTVVNRIATAFLAAWYFYGMSVLEPAPDAADVLGNFLVLGALGVSAFRLVVYCAGYRPPISLVGRVVTGRLVIPGYDKVFLAPLVTTAAALALPPLLIGLGLAPNAGLCLTMGLSVSLGLCLGPSLVSWRLTGTHRMSPALSNAQYVQI